MDSAAGLFLDFAVREVTSTRALDPELIAKFEQDSLKRPGTVKVEGRSLTFRAVPAYLLAVSRDDARNREVSVVFCANRRVYMVSLSGSSVDMDKVPDPVKLLESFYFTRRPVFSAPK